MLTSTGKVVLKSARSGPRGLMCGRLMMSLDTMAPLWRCVAV